MSINTWHNPYSGIKNDPTIDYTKDCPNCLAPTTLNRVGSGYCCTDIDCSLFWNKRDNVVYFGTPISGGWNAMPFDDITSAAEYPDQKRIKYLETRLRESRHYAFKNFLEKMELKRQYRRQHLKARTRHTWVYEEEREHLKNMGSRVCAICKAHVCGPPSYPNGSYTGKDDECPGEPCKCSSCQPPTYRSAPTIVNHHRDIRGRDWAVIEQYARHKDHPNDGIYGHPNTYYVCLECAYHCCLHSNIEPGPDAHNCPIKQPSMA